MAERHYNIRISLGERELVSIDDFRLADSCITILFGESGIGKSLSALAIAGLLDPDQLDVQIDGKPYETYMSGQEAQDIRRNGFFVFQEPSSHLNPLLKLRTQLREGSLAGGSDEKQVLERLWPGTLPSALDEILDVYPKPYRPSGGEKQRILAAMAFKKMSAVEPSAPGSLFIFDEPTGNLDNELRDQFLDLLVDKFRKHNSTVLLITHDYSMISRFTKSYSAVAKRILYKELSLVRGELRLRDFQPDEYLSWLTQNRSGGTSRTGGATLLTLDPNVQVFGRALRVSRDRAGKVATPLLIRKGSITYLKAPSGVGKTTIVKLMMGLLKAEKMSMHLGSSKYTEATPRSAWARQVWGHQMTMVFQHADEALNQNARVKDVFAGLPLSVRVDDAMVVKTLSELFDEKPDQVFLHKLVKHLSGGQKQRLNLLRALVLDTDILILDEPLNGLDFASAVKVLSKVEDKLRDGKGVLIISHNEEIFDAVVKQENTYYLHAPA